ncbi:PAS domain S-box protein [Zhouia sp. PK063]|uniref:PAS domain S-box protein n=1 Tax=Zhouia sp. PK063 TaxID=3373602 RepID=UPI0037936377
METQEQQIALLQRALERERASRKLSERILEEKSLELYHLTQKLKNSNTQLEDLLREKTNELQGVFTNITDAFVVIDISGNVLKMNTAAVDLLEYDVEKEPINLITLVRPDHISYTQNAFKELYHKGKFTNYRAIIVTKTGKEKFVQVNASIVYNQEGTPIAAQGIVRDITQETANKLLIEEQKSQLKLIVDNSPIGIVLLHKETNKPLMVNQALSTMLGYSIEELTEMDLYDIIHPEDAKVSRKNRRLLKKGEINSYNLEKRFFRKDGAIVWAKTSIAAVRSKNGQIRHLVGTLEDITKHKMANEKLVASENRLSTLVLNLQSGVLLEDENGKVQLVNQQFCNMFNINLTPDALIGMDCAACAEVAKQQFTDSEAFVTNIKKAIKNKTKRLEEELHLTDGRIFERNYIPIVENGKYSGHLWSYNDVTIQRNYEQSLEHQKEKYSNIIANMNLGLLEVDLEDRVVFANQSFSNISGYALEDIRGKKAANLILDPAYSPIFDTHNDKRKEGVSDSYEVRVFNKQGDQRYWLISGAPNYNVNGKQIGSIGIHLDITKQKQLEIEQKQLLKNLEEQNEQLNEYAHVVSHDLKSPLHSMNALLNWLKEDYKQFYDQNAIQIFQQLDTKLEKMNDLIEGILTYSSVSDVTTLKQHAVNVEEVIKDIKNTIYIPEHVSITIKNPLPIIKGDKTRILQLFQNILTNAVTHIDKPQGMVTIDVKSTKNFWEFSIEDNGIGIPKAYHKKIFDIFETYSSNKRSTGIGLSIVKKIVALYDGKIWLNSEEGLGTTFFFTLKK